MIEMLKMKEYYVTMSKWCKINMLEREKYGKGIKSLMFLVICFWLTTYCLLSICSKSFLLYVSVLNLKDWLSKQEMNYI